MKISITIISCVMAILNSACQNLDYYTSGHCYGFEKNVALQALDCVERKCISGLKRSNFIDERTIYNEAEIYEHIDSLVKLSDKEITLFNSSFRLDLNIPMLTFYRTYFFKSNNEIFFQIKLELEYDRGLLVAKKIEIINSDFIFTPAPSLRSNYDSDVGNKTNMPFPPPVDYDGDYELRGLNLCYDCTFKRMITKDNKANYILNEKYSYESLSRINNEYLIAKKENLFGVITYENEEIFPFIYDKIVVNTLEYFILTKDGKIGLSKFNGDVLLPVEYQDVKIRLCYQNNSTMTIFLTKKDGLCGVLNSTGEVIVPAVYDDIELFYSKYFRVKKDGKFGMLSTKGEIILDVTYKEIDYEHNKFQGFKITNKKGKKQSVMMIEEGERKFTKKDLKLILVD